MFIYSNSSLCRMRQPAWSPGLIAKTTSRQFLLACTGCQCASESPTRRWCLCGSACTLQPLAVWLTCVCRPTLCMVASNYVPRRLGLCWSRVPGLLPVSAASPSMDHEHGTVCQPILEHQIRPSAPSSVISRPTCFSSSLRCCLQVGSALFVRRRCDCLASSAPFTNIQTYLLTYLCMYVCTDGGCVVFSGWSLCGVRRPALQNVRRTNIHVPGSLPLPAGSVRHSLVWSCHCRCALC